MKVCAQLRLIYSAVLTIVSRNLPRCQGRVREVRQGSWYEGASTYRRQQTVKWGGQDLRQIWYTRISRQSPSSSGWQEVRWSHRRYDLLFRGEFDHTYCCIWKLTWSRKILKSLLGSCSSIDTVYPTTAHTLIMKIAYAFYIAWPKSEYRPLLWSQHIFCTFRFLPSWHKRSDVEKQIIEIRSKSCRVDRLI